MPWSKFSYGTITCDRCGLDTLETDSGKEKAKKGAGAYSPPGQDDVFFCPRCTLARDDESGITSLNLDWPQAAQMMEQKWQRVVQDGDILDPAGDSSAAASAEPQPPQLALADAAVPPPAAST